MDTRSKIVSSAEARRVAAAGATIVSGYFDPVTHAVAADLANAKLSGALPLLVLIADPAEPILPTRARAELIAGLACVDFVCDAPTDIAPHRRLETEDMARLERLIERVAARQAAK